MTTARVKLYSIASLVDGSYSVEFAVIRRGITKLIRKYMTGAQLDGLRRFWDSDNKRFYSGQKLAAGLTWDTLPIENRYSLPLTLTIYQYEDQETDDELDPDYQLTDTLYDHEPMSFDDIARKIRDYDAVQPSCSSICKNGHCWLSSEPDYPCYGEGGQTYVDVFVHYADCKKQPVQGALLAALLHRAKTI